MERTGETGGEHGLLIGKPGVGVQLGGCPVSLALESGGLSLSGRGRAACCCLFSGCSRSFRCWLMMALVEALVSCMLSMYNGITT